MAEGRILAVKIDGKLFDKLDEFVEQEGMTKQKYVSELISKDISLRMQQKAVQNKDLDIKHTDGLKTWDRAEVMDAIDDFMLQNRRIPKQTEFKNENGLPSYNAAGRALEMSPAEYMKERFDELMIGQEEEDPGMSMGM
ncbi:MAG: hypothetical protein IKI97_06505 [Clostridia bacterium]|nr:hypothetical protein [Clostridia bacterium]